MSRSFARWVQVSLLALATSTAVVGCKKRGGSAQSEAPKKSTSSRTPTGKHRFADSMPVTTPKKPPMVVTNQLANRNLFVDPESLAMLNLGRVQKSDPDKAKLLSKIAYQPQGIWMGGWNSDIFRAVEHFVERAKAANQVPVMIAYNIPNRDCGSYSAGGLSSKESYQRWIRNVAAAIGRDTAVVVLEPDALGHFQECLSEEQKQERLFLLNDAVQVLRQNPNTAVYLDAGHPRWQPAPEIARRLTLAGVEYANGFSINVSNYVATDECIKYGDTVSELLAGKHYVIDTSRNGAGHYAEAKTEEETWCNPPGRKLGKIPTTQTASDKCDAYLWLKRPGESDGECRGGPRAGVWWMEQALELAR